MSLPKVAVITIYHNRETNVNESVQSLIDQVYENLDIVIVDDCSKDATFEKLQEMQLKDNRVIVKRNEINKGFTRTLIDTIAELDVKYIAIHGSGDISLPTRIASQVNYLENNPDFGVISVGLVTDKESRIEKGGVVSISIDDLLIKNRITHGAVMFRVTDYFKAGGYRPFFSSRQDKDLWYRMALITKIGVIDAKLYKNVVITNSVSLTASKTSIPTMLSGFATYLIKERISMGYDSLDKYGDKSALFFNPTQSNKLYYTNIKKNLYRRNYQVVEDYINILLKINRGKIHVLSLKIFSFIIKKLNR